MLAAARASGELCCKLCQKILHIFIECYESMEVAAIAAVAVVIDHLLTEKCKYSVKFNGCANKLAHRNDYIDVIVAALKEQFGKVWRLTA